MMILQICGRIDLKKGKNSNIRNFFIIIEIIQLVKANFNIKKNPQTPNKSDSTKSDELSEEEFEKFVSKSGAAGTFMIFRSTKKDDELGIDEL